MLLGAGRSHTISCTLVVAAGATLEIEPGAVVGVAPAGGGGVYGGGPAPGASMSASELLTLMEGRGMPRRTVAALLAGLDADGDCAVDAAEWRAIDGATEELAAAYLGAPAVVVERGGTLVARGEVDAPITFALRVGGALLAESEGPPTKHEAWGGLVVMGAAPTAAGAALPSTGCWSGVATAVPYGGYAREDSSGALRYVRLWHTQRGLALHGVGGGTAVSHVEVVSSATDGVVLHGGTVDVSHLSSLNAARAGFRARAGYSGEARFTFAMLGAAGRVGWSLAAEQPEEAYAAKPPLAPRVFSLTILGGGSAGSAAAAGGSLIELGDGGGGGGSGNADAMRGAFGDALLLHGSGSGVRLPAALRLVRQAHPPPPPYTAYGAALLKPGAQCARQAADGVSEGVWLGVHASAAECAQAAGAYREANASSSDCLTFQHSAAYPLWGCLCCHTAEGGPWHSAWSVYQTTPSTAAASAAPIAPWWPTLFLAPSTIVHNVAGGAFVQADGGPVGAAAAFEARLADPGLVDVASDCLSLACVRAAGTCAAAFSPLPSADGAACAARADDAPALGIGSRFGRGQCAGAFASWHAADNWLAGWSHLFPTHVGEAPRGAYSLRVPSDGATSVTVATGFLAASAAVLARKAAELSVLTVRFEPQMCATSAFSADPDAHAHGPVYWLLLRPRQSGTLRLSTCSSSTQHALGFDTDLAVFRPPAASAACSPPEQLACNGDGFGEGGGEGDDGGCQLLYSALSTPVEAGERYLVAIKPHESGSLGDNVTLRASVVVASPPPLAPPPPSPPPSPQVADLQLRIDEAAAAAAAEGSAPLLIHLDTDTALAATVTVPAGRRVVVRGTNSTARRAVVRAVGDFRLFDVADGGELYLSNLLLERGRAVDGCGGAVRVRGRGALVAQFCRFERNLARRGGAICVEGDGRLHLVAVNASGNTAADGGANVYLGRPLSTFPRVDLLGVCLGADLFDCAQWTRVVLETISHVGRWTSASCPAAAASGVAEGAQGAAGGAAVGAEAACAFHRVGSFSPPSHASCAPLRPSSLTSLTYGSVCSCEQGASGGTAEQAALSPYGLAPVDEVLGLQPRLFCRDTLTTIIRPQTRGSNVLDVHLRKGGPSESRHTEQSTVNVTVVVVGVGLYAGAGHVDELYTWSVRPLLGHGRYNLSSCMQRYADTGASLGAVEALEFDTGDTCERPEDGSLQLDDVEQPSGARLIDTHGGSGPVFAGPAWFARSLLKFPISFSAVHVRETDERDAYEHQMEVRACTYAHSHTHIQHADTAIRWR